MRKVLLLLSSVFFCMSVLAQQTVNVSGTVVAKDGSPVSATVMIKGTTRGTTTDARGHYKFDGVPANATLVFSSISYQTLEEAVGGRTTVNASLDFDAQSLDEVIAVAYGTARKGTFTGSADVINAKDLENKPVTTFQNAIIGKAPGVQVTSGSGQAGANTSIRIRGIGSLAASSDPLYVVDGVVSSSGSAGQLDGYLYSPVNNIMNTINPNDIESITILKDAAASALYGSRAANGVVLITTKKGKVGRTRVNLNTSVAWTPSWATDNYEKASVQENVNMLYQVFWDANSEDGLSDEDATKEAIRMLGRFNKHGYKFRTDGIGRYQNVIIEGLTDGLENREGKYFDWEKAYFRTGQYQNYDLSVSGGNDNTKYYSSIAYTKDQSRIKVNNLDRITGRLNLSQKLGKFFALSSDIGVSNMKFSGYNDTRNLYGNYFLQTRNLLWGLYWPTDYKTGLPYTARYGSYAYNGLYYDNEWENTSKTFRVWANEALTLHLLPGLNLKSLVSYDNTNVKDHIYYSANHYNGSNDKGVVNEMVTINTRLLSSTTLNYNKSFGEHNLDLLAGFEAEKWDGDYTRATGRGLPASGLHTAATAGKLESSAYSWGNSMLSYLSRAEYNYMQKYYASASYRRDGSSKLSAVSRWGDFWSVAGAWRINRESFLADNHAISNLRLRASYGVNGTLPGNNYGYISLVSYTNKYMDVAGSTITTVADEKLRWETNYTTNIGLDFGLFDQRLFATIEYFNRDSRDLLQNVPISTVTGLSSTLKNVGEINNNGIELTLGGDIVRNAQFRWNVTANASFIKSKVTKLYDGKEIIWEDPTGDDERAQFIYREGQSTLAFFGYEWAGVDPDNGKSRWYVNDPDNKAAGDFTLNGRGATYDFDNANYVILGSANPKVYGGLSSELQYSNFTLSMNFIYKIGGYIYDGAYKDVADDGYYWERIRAKSEWDNMWTDANKSGTLPKLSGLDLTDPQQFSSRQMHDATFLRLKNITFSYNIPGNILNRVGINNVTIYTTATNFLTFSKYKEADPEVNNYGTRGWETPFGKTYAIGLNLGF